jgi:hypothetical protein
MLQLSEPLNAWHFVQPVEFILLIIKHPPLSPSRVKFVLFCTSSSATIPNGAVVQLESKNKVRINKVKSNFIKLKQF